MAESVGSPGRIPPVLTGTAAHIPKFEEWDPEGDITVPLAGTDALYVPTIVRAPPQLPRPQEHPQRQDFPARQYQRFFNQTPSALNNQLGFTASSVRIDNYSSHWVFLQSAGMYIPPFIYGAIVTLYPGVSLAQFALSPPTGYADPTPVLESTIVTIWYEGAMVNNPGIPIQSSFRVGAAGGAVLGGNLLFNPDNTYDIGASGANRPRNIYVAGNVISGAFLQAGWFQFGIDNLNLFSGVGVPSAGAGGNGDFYFRQDTPGTANQRIYVKSAGAWVGIV